MLKIAICDDNNNDLNNTKKMVKEIFAKQKIEYELTSFTSPNKMLEELQRIDIGILDISMEELNGIDLGRKIKEKFPNVRLIYTTSYAQFCIKAINDVHAFSFLCKPFEEKEMEAQILDALSGFSEESLVKEFYKVKDSNGRKYVSIKLKLEDIVYFEYIKRQRRISIISVNETYEFEEVFEKLAEELEHYDFVVNCRGNLVNLNHIVKIKGYTIFLDNEQTLPLSQKRNKDFGEKMNAFLQKRI